MVKDLSAKAMTKCTDVFSDICNVNLFDSDPVIEPEELEQIPSDDEYRDASGRLREHRMDVRMRHKKSQANIAIFCLENQSGVCNTMPVRDMGYLYSGYSEQIRQKRRQNEQNGKKYVTKELGDDQKLLPVISLVLYYGTGEWTGPRSVRDLLSVPEEWRERIEPLIADHSIRLVHLAAQDEATRSRYQSDFRHVVDYLAYSRQKDEENLRRFREDPDRKLIHPEEFMDMMYAFTKDSRYYGRTEEIQSLSRKQEARGGEVTMCMLMDMVENDGIQKGREQERERLNRLNARLVEDGRVEELLQATKDLLKQENLMAEYGI